jgi:hypothetical protein
MTVDFAWGRAPAFRVASITRVGPWKPDNLRAEFRELTSWAKAQHARTGRWIFYERTPLRWEACLEVRGKPTPAGRIRLKTLPAVRVVRVVFDPDHLSSRIVYHGLHDWTRWRKKEGKIRGVSATREIYSGDPWTDAKAWAHCEVQFVVRP